LLDAVAAPDERHPLLYYPPGEDPEPLLRFTYVDDTPLRAAPLTPPAPLAANPIAAPVLGRAERHSFVFAGGAQPMHMQPKADPSQPGQPAPPQPPHAGHDHANAWTVNGKAMVHDSGSTHSHGTMPPALT